MLPSSLLGVNTVYPAPFRQIALSYPLLHTHRCLKWPLDSETAVGTPLEDYLGIPTLFTLFVPAIDVLSLALVTK